VASSIHDHGTVTDFNKDPMMDFPAGYPVFLSGVMFVTGRDTLQFGPVLNALLFAAVIYLCGWLMERFSFRSKWYKWILLSLIVLSPCLLEVYSMIWSETLFILLLLLFILVSRRYFLSHTVRALLAMGLITGLACVTRYAGVTFIGAGGLLLLCDPGLRRGRKIRHILLFGLVSCVPLVINLYRNKQVTGTLTGFREKGVTSLSANLHDLGAVFCSWLPVPGNHYALAWWLGLLWILVFIVAYAVRLMRKERLFSYENIATLYFIVYAVFILFSATVSRFQPLDSRLLSPLFIPWLWGSTCWIPVWTAAWPSIKRIGAVFAVAVAAIAMQTGQLMTDYETWDGVKYAGIPGYTEDGWRNSETMRYVRENKQKLRAGATLYSNATEGIWFLAGLHADMIPHKDFAADIKEFLAEDHFYVIWFNDSINPDLLPLDSIARHKTLSSVQTFSDGATYLFTTPGAPKPGPNQPGPGNQDGTK
jgi:MFS family permease